MLTAVAVVAGAIMLLLFWYFASLLFRRRFQFSIRSLLVLTVAVALPSGWLAVGVRQAARQRQCIHAIAKRGGLAFYEYQVKEDSVEVDAQSLVPEALVNWLGVDFFHRVTAVWLFCVKPCGWEETEHIGGVLPLTTLPQSDVEWAKAALRQHVFGDANQSIIEDYCQESLRLNPHNVEANLLLGERWEYSAPLEAKPHLEAVLRDTDPASLEYAQAEKLLAHERWTFEELSERVGTDGVLR